MTLSREYCEAWPQELKEAERQCYHAACRVKMLEAKLDRSDPSEFDQLMDQLDAAYSEMWRAGYRKMGLKYVYLMGQEGLKP